MLKTTTDIIPTTYATSTDHLLAGLAYIDLRVRWAVARARAGGLDPQDEFRGLYVSDTQIDALLDFELGGHSWLGNGRHNGSSPTEWLTPITQARTEWQQQTTATLATGLHLTFAHLQRAFTLSPLEIDIFLIALAPELDPRYERIFAYLQDDVTKKRPSIDLILNLLTDSYGEKLQLRELFGTNSCLLQSRLLTRFASPSDREPTLLGHYLRPAPSVVEYLLDQTTPDEQLDGIARITYPNLHTLISAPNRLTPEFHHQLHTANQTSPAPLFAFSGNYGVGKQEAAQYLAAAAERPLIQLDCATLQESEIGLADGITRLLRDGRLHQATLYLTNWDALLTDGKIPAAHFQNLLTYPHTLIIASEAAWQAGQRNKPRPIFPITFPTLTYERRLAIWQDHVATAELDLRPLANHFRFTPGQIADAAASAHDLAQWRGQSLTTADLFTASRQHSNQKLATLATKIQPRYHWHEIILPDDTLAQLQEMVNVVQQRPIVYGQWGFGQKQALGKGLNALFAGESGTGKTMSADIMANELGLDLYKIDLSSLVSKYIGETEKNLDRIFTEATTSNAILFFDEADAIFGKRSEVKDSHDRYANIEISYLLQRMEAYDGVVILATNLRANMDDAFTRRLHFAIEFPFPEATDRERIWHVNVPSQTPLAGDVDFEQLAHRFRLAGGSIRNIILAAAFLAATDKAIHMKHFLHATRREYQKMGRLIDERLFETE